MNAAVDIKNINDKLKALTDPLDHLSQSIKYYTDSQTADSALQQDVAAPVVTAAAQSVNVSNTGSAAPDAVATVVSAQSAAHQQEVDNPPETAEAKAEEARLKAAAEANAAANPAAEAKAAAKANPAAEEERLKKEKLKAPAYNLDMQMQFKTKNGEQISLERILNMLKNNKCQLTKDECKNAGDEINNAKSEQDVKNIIDKLNIFKNSIQSGGTRKPRMHRRKKTQRKRSKTIKKKNRAAKRK
jgi:hypothetical protein